ncbi:5-exo-alcohol dehydrogenase [Virgisporangium aliadipatigenens]|uniref:5-exo-alcohol dehydrogenase n=1 Tax=Virgisporangium aliadipatigenens TaxID=741659 RepID=A0A8J3YI27_9ACTN|nr:zinc-binding dehydrogenase [Virgisporangium aliadipatigenens]GIJ44346.1 5-exo-alcohol dehydrogenase [Virgisporangium aliadipatigenens]
MINAVVMPNPGAPLETRAFDRPALEPGAILLRTLGSEVCGTDGHLWKGQLAGVPYPIIPGHVSVGEIAAFGPGEPPRDVDGAPLRVGQTVTFLDVYGTCGRCWYCTVGKASTRCPYRKVYGVTMSADDGLYGGWAEYIHLRPGVHVVPLPDGFAWRAFLAGGCGMPTALHAVSLGEIAFGDTVLVQGAGPVGLCAAVLAQLRGAGQVIVVGGPDVRLAAARRFGADLVLDIATLAESERLQAVREVTGGRGADVTIEATGVPSAVPEGMRLTRDAGRYVVVGQYTDAGTATFNPHLDLNKKHLDVRGCWGSDAGHVYRSVRVMARYAAQFPWTELISREYGLDEAQRALADVAAQRVVKALIVPARDGTAPAPSAA